MKILVLLFLMMPVISLGQELFIDFESGELSDWYGTSESHWCIVDSDALAGEHSLRHCYDDSVSGTSWIARAHPALSSEYEAEWEFSIRYKFSPSSKNNWAVMLSEKELPDSEGALTSGLVIGVNYCDNSDEIKIWLIDNGEVCEMGNTGLNWNEDALTDKIIRFRLHMMGETCSFQVESENKKQQETVQIPLRKQIAPAMFILFSRYTKSQDQGLWLDDIRIKGVFLPDELYPEIHEVYVLNTQELEVEFSEPVMFSDRDQVCIRNLGCSPCRQIIGNSFSFRFEKGMLPGRKYRLELPDLSDLQGNMILTGKKSFDFYYPARFDVLIHELLPDPFPKVFLPPAEYIELVNRSGEHIALKNWTIQVNKKLVKIPSLTLDKDAFCLLIKKGVINSSPGSSSVLEMQDWPALNNEKATILLRNGAGDLIHWLEYDREWHSLTDKKEGGWSLEMIDPSEPCLGSVNWVSSTDFKGGTPGEPNSVSGISDESGLPPEVWWISIIDSSSLFIRFSEPMDSFTIIQKEFYSVDHGIGIPEKIEIAQPVTHGATLLFNSEFSSGVSYGMTISPDLKDCAGNSIRNAGQITFNIPGQANPHDIIINEILYDPDPGCHEFIEIYNRSLHGIDLTESSLVVGNDTTVIVMEPRVIASGEYAVITRSYAGVDGPGRFGQGRLIIRVSKMAALPNDGSTLTLLDSKGQMIDEVCYSPDAHHEILINTKGVSLERISGGKSGKDPDNWISASSDAGYKTPGELNSQNEFAENYAAVEVRPRHISPDGDGVEDKLIIYYNMDEAGYMARIFVFSPDGRNVGNVAEGILLGTEGEMIFEGFTESGVPLPSGMYILYFHAYHPGGKIIEKKFSFVVFRQEGY